MFKKQKKKKRKIFALETSRWGKTYKYLVHVKRTPSILKKTQNTILQFQDLEI